MSCKVKKSTFCVPVEIFSQLTYSHMLRLQSLWARSWLMPSEILMCLSLRDMSHYLEKQTEVYIVGICIHLLHKNYENMYVCRERVTFCGGSIKPPRSTHAVLKVLIYQNL